MDGEKLKARLGRHGQPLDLILLPETPSTNTFALDLLAKGRPAPFLVVAQRQSAGRGRLGRTWESMHEKGIWASLAVAGINADNAFCAVQAMSVAITLALGSAARGTIAIKWPNDVLCGNRKIAGILAEAGIIENGLVIGFGINVNHGSSDFSSALTGVATSLFIETGRTFGLEDILGDILRLFYHWSAHPDLAEKYSALCATIGKHCDINGRKFLAKAIAPDGSLVVENENGIEETIYSGTLRYI